VAAFVADADAASVAAHCANLLQQAWYRREGYDGAGLGGVTASSSSSAASSSSAEPQASSGSSSSGSSSASAGSSGHAGDGLVWVHKRLAARWGLPALARLGVGRQYVVAAMYRVLGIQQPPAAAAAAGGGAAAAAAAPARRREQQHHQH
jgi:hypothetical protein